jgi:hypothetical protein
MPQFVTSNQTHYDTMDVQCVVSHMVRVLKSESSKGWTIRDPQEGFGLRYWKGRERIDEAPRPARRRRAARARRVPADEEWEEEYVSTWFNYRYRQSKKRPSENIRVLKPGAVDEMQGVLALARLAEEGRFLPDEAAAQIAAMGAYLLGFRRKKRHMDRYENLGHLLVRAREVVADGKLRIQIRDLVQDPKKSRRLTEEERAAHWGKVYSEGRKAKKIEWCNENYLLPAIRQYELAWRETLPQLERAQKAGAEVEPHLTPAEILRKLADKWEEEEHI